MKVSKWAIGGLFVLALYIAVISWSASWFMELQEEAAFGRQCIEQSSRLVSIGNSVAEGIFEVTRDPQMVNTVGALRLMAGSPASEVLAITRKRGKIE